VGRLFGEFGFVLAIAVGLSGFAALTLCPPLCAAVLKSHQGATGFMRLIDRCIGALVGGYRAMLAKALDMPVVVLVVGVLASLAAWPLYQHLPRELTPAEDRGTFFVSVTAPEGANVAYTDTYIRQIVSTLEPLREQGTADRVFAITGAMGLAKRGSVVVGLADWADRDQSASELVAAIRPKLADVAGVQAFPTMPAGLGLRASRQPLQVVVGGPEFGSVAEWARLLTERLEALPGLADVEIGYEVNSPQLRVRIDRERADDLGISVRDVGNALQTMLASREITTFVDRGREYPVIVQATAEDRQTPADLANIFVRARDGDLVPLGSLVTVDPEAASPELTRFDRLRSVSIGASLAPGYDLGGAIDEVRAIAAEILPPEARIAFDGQAREYLEASSGLLITFGLAVLVVFLVLAAQFESFVHPVTIVLAVPLALAGALASLWLTGTSLNVYSQIAVILLVGLIAKNGILIVEFANQLRDAGMATREAILDSASTRLRPILMTVLATILGAVPLALSSGAGSESRAAIGIVIVGGLGLATLLNLVVTPVIYELLARFAQPAGARAARIEREMASPDEAPAE
jgi:multidrug efflux pump